MCSLVWRIEGGKKKRNRRSNKEYDHAETSHLHLSVCCNPHGDETTCDLIASCMHYRDNVMHYRDNVVQLCACYEHAYARRDRVQFGDYHPEDRSCGFSPLTARLANRGVSHSIVQFLPALLYYIYNGFTLHSVARLSV